MRPHGVEELAAEGQWGTVRWATDANGDMPASEFFASQSETDRAKLQALFQRLADFGRIDNEEKFKNLGAKAGKAGRGLFEFKSFQLRFFGDFRPGKQFVVAHGTRKKKDDLSRSDIDTSVRVLAEHDARQGKRK